MEIAIERLTGIALFVVAMSHILQPRGWAEFFAQLRARGAPGAFVNAMMSLSFGVVIVGFHGTVWRGWPMLVTIVGWGSVAKAFVHMCFPAYSLRSMALVPVEKAWKFSAGGAIMLPLAVAILVAAW